MKQLTGIAIRPMADGDEMATADLVMRVFMRHVGYEYTDEGIAEFARYAAADALRRRVDDRTSTVLVAIDDRTIVGVIEFRGEDHVALMFVDDDYQRRGIAGALFDAVRTRVNARGGLTVNSSRYAIPVYERLGFEVEGAERTVNGITFIPMRRSSG